MVINKESKHAKDILRFLEWVHMDQSNYDLLMYGINGKDYTLQENKVNFDVINGKTPLYGWPGYEAFLDDTLTRGFSSDPADLDIINNQINNNNSRYSPTAGFKSNYTGDLKKICNRRAWLRHIFYWSSDTGTFSNSFDEGDISKRNLDDIVNEIIRDEKNYGIDKLAEETQKQLDEWRKSKK